jgi:hypothetical protein
MLMAACNTQIPRDTTYQVLFWQSNEDDRGAQVVHTDAMINMMYI